MKFSLQQVADLLGGKVEGNPADEVFTLSKIEEGQSGSLCFLANLKYTSFLYQTHATAVIVSQDFIPERPFTSSLIRVEDPYASFGRLLEIYNQIKMPQPGVSELAVISPSAIIGNHVSIGAGVVVSDRAVIEDDCILFPQVFIGTDCIVGKGTQLFPGVKIYSDCVIGKKCRLHAGVVIGADGFGFALQADQASVKISQIGNVVIGDEVEIGANSCVDRATMGSTRIANGVKLDNLIQIGHNVEIGENTVIAAQTGIAGSSKIGKNCVIGGQVGIVGHLVIGDNVKIAGQSGIESNLKNDAVVQGSPAFDVVRYKKSYIHFRNLKEIEKRLSDLENKTGK